MTTSGWNRADRIHGIAFRFREPDDLETADQSRATVDDPFTDQRRIFDQEYARQRASFHIAVCR